LLNKKEFYQGRMFIDSYECNAVVLNGLLDNVLCQHVSNIGSIGLNNPQAIVNQRLKYESSASSSSDYNLGI
jgi:hypothetical protein